MDELVVKYEAIIANQQRRAVSTSILPPIQLPASILSSQLPIYTPPPPYYTPPKTYSPSPTNQIDFYRGLDGRILSSSNGANYFYDLNGRLDHVSGPSGTAQMHYGLNGDLSSISY